MEFNKASVPGASGTAGPSAFIAHCGALWLWRAVRVGEGMVHTAAGGCQLIESFMIRSASHHPYQSVDT